MVGNTPDEYYWQTPSRTEQSPACLLNSANSDYDDGMSPLRPRAQNVPLFNDYALQEVGARANIPASYHAQAHRELADVMADLTETCHISTGKRQSKLRSDITAATHAGRASSLPYPPLFRNTNPMAAGRSATSSSPLQSPLEPPLDSASVSPTGVSLDNPFDVDPRINSANGLHPGDSFTSLATPSVCSELDSELGTEVDTDIDSETEPDTEAEPEACVALRREMKWHYRLSDQPLPQQHDQVHEPVAAKPDTMSHGHTSVRTNGSTQMARDTSTPMVRQRYMYHASNRSAIGISFSENENESSEARDSFKESTSPAPAPRALRSSFNRAARLWIPPSKVRRTQSMFATPEQLLHEQVGHIERPMNRLGQPEVTFTGILGTPACPLSTFKVKQDPFERITHDVLCRLLDGEFSDTFSEVIVIDCRFEYEYEGGHISGAVNVNSKKQLEL